MNEISKYNIIIPKQKNEKKEKAGIEYEIFKDAWIKIIFKVRYILKNTHIFTKW